MPTSVIRYWLQREISGNVVLGISPAHCLPLQFALQLNTSLQLNDVSQVLVAQKVTTGVYKGVTTSELDDLAAETAASMTATHPDYATVETKQIVLFKWLVHCVPHERCLPTALLNLSVGLQLAARIAISNLHKNTLKSFSET